MVQASNKVQEIRLDTVLGTVTSPGSLPPVLMSSRADRGDESYPPGRRSQT
jgi:hypothetical protein